MQVTNCRICKNAELKKFLELGNQPLANSFLRKEDLKKPEPTYPLNLVFCNNCGLVQLDYVVPPELMFKSYLWVSGTSDAVPVHFQQLADESTKIVGAGENSLVVDIGSNDGTLLKGFKKVGIRTLGVEPATNIAEIARKSGIETVNDFFNSATAEKIVKEKSKAKIITATNVVAHINDSYDLLAGVSVLLEDDGAFVIEVPYLVDMIQNNEFDTAYHEHLSYFAIRPLTELFKSFDMEIFDVKRFPIHGGTIRIYVKKKSSNLKTTAAVGELLKLEEEMELDKFETYLEFADRIKRLKENLISLLKKLRSEGKNIIGYGAPAKGNTLLNFFGIDTKLLDYIADKNPLKHGLLTPGMHIPVVPVEKILEDKPDYMFILAWNFADEVMRQQQKYKDIGGKFIIPIPGPRIV